MRKEKKTKIEKLQTSIVCLSLFVLLLGFVSTLSVFANKTMQEDLSSMQQEVWKAQSQCDSLRLVNKTQEEYLEIAGFLRY